MYTRLSELKNLTIRAADGEIGRCRDFLFDDQHWTVRYLEVNTSRWLLGRRVLISPAVVGIPDLKGKRLPVNLTRSEIEHAPGLLKDQPVSRQFEAEYARHFGQLYYWSGNGIWGMGAYPGDILEQADMAALLERQSRDDVDGDEHLRSAAEVMGYKIHALDGNLGEVSDFIVDTRSWSIVFAALETRRWLPGRQLLLPIAWATTISWLERTFGVDVSREDIATAPELEEPISVEAVVAYYKHFGRRAHSAAGREPPAG